MADCQAGLSAPRLLLHPPSSKLNPQSSILGLVEDERRAVILWASWFRLMPEKKNDWTLSAEALERLLVGLDSDRTQAAEKTDPSEYRTGISGTNRKLLFHGARPLGPKSMARRVLWLAVICSVSAAFWVLDHRPEFYMGDSGSYLLTAVQGFIPPDRSFVYGFFIRLIALPFHSLKPLFVAQAIAAVLSCAGLAACCKFYGPPGIRERAPLLMAFLLAVEPMHLMFQRYVLTEALTMPVFIAYLMFALSYLLHNRGHKLVMVQVLGIVLISMRLIFLPLVLANAVVLPFLRRGNASFPGRLAHLAMNLILVIVLHGGYCILNGKLSNEPPAYTYWDGFVQLSAWAPAVTIRSAANPQVAEIIRHGAEYELNKFDRRYYQLWDQKGVVFRIKSIAPDPVTANQWAKATARNALFQDPLTVLKVVLQTYIDFNTYAKISNELHIDRGDDRPVSSNLVMRLNHYFKCDSYEFDVRNGEYWQKHSLTKTIQDHAALWMLLLVQTPYLCLLTGIIRRECRLQCLYLCLVCVIYLATVCSLTPLVVTRLLYPLTIPFFLCAAWLFSQPRLPREPAAT